MTNELAQQDSPFGGNVTPFGRNTAPAPRQQDSFVRLQSWTDTFINCATVAKHLAVTEFVPAAFQGKPESIAAAMMKGLELGIDPLDALQNIYVVKGKVGFSAEFMRRRIIEAGHEIVLKESTDTRCVIRGRRKDSEEWQQVTFTAENAKAAGIDIKAYPSDKLVARASSRLFRRVFPDVMSGTAIIEDVIEVGDQGAIVDVEPEAVAKAVESAPVQRKTATRKAPAKKTAKSEKVNDPGDQPLLPDEEPADEPAEQKVTEVNQTASGDEAATPAQVQKLAIVLGKEGLDDRQAKLDYLSDQVGRQIKSSKELSKREASDLIDYLETAQAADSEKGRA